MTNDCKGGEGRVCVYVRAVGGGGSVMVGDEMGSVVIFRR